MDDTENKQMLGNMEGNGYQKLLFSAKRTELQYHYPFWGTTRPNESEELAAIKADQTVPHVFMLQVVLKKHDGRILQLRNVFVTSKKDRLSNFVKRFKSEDYHETTPHFWSHPWSEFYPAVSQWIYSLLKLLFAILLLDLDGLTEREQSIK